MAFCKSLKQNTVILVILLAIQLIAIQAHATLVFYYDPDTGNVSFDTANTRSGKVFVYSLHVYQDKTPIRFIEENHIKLSNSTLITTHDQTVGEVTLQGLSGLYTIGNVLPTGLSEETWSYLFRRSHWRPAEGTLGQHDYTDIIGGGGPPLADFIYGPPESEFDNKWDFVDPDTLIWADAAKLIYRQATGELVYDTSGINGGYTVGFYLQSSGEFIPQEFVAPPEFPLNSASADQIDMLADAVEPGAYSLGNVLQPGLSMAEYEALITNARYISRAGFAGGDIDLETDGIALSLVFEAVPEPSSMLLAALACGAILMQRSKVH